MALCSVGEDGVEEGMFSEFGVEVLESAFVAGEPSLVVTAAEAEEVFVVELGMDEFGDFAVDVRAIVGEAESRGGVGVGDVVDGCEWDGAAKEVASDHVVWVGAA